MSQQNFPDWVSKVIYHLAAMPSDQTPEQIAQAIHEALEIAEAEKYATEESRFSFGLIDATPDDVDEIRRHLSKFENSIVEIERK